MYVRMGLADGVLGQRGKARGATQWASTPSSNPRPRAGAGEPGGVTAVTWSAHCLFSKVTPSGIRRRTTAFPLPMAAVGGTPGGAGCLKVWGPLPTPGQRLAVQGSCRTCEPAPNPRAALPLPLCSRPWTAERRACLWMEFPNQIISPG